MPDQLFVNIAISIGHEINRALEFIQDVALGGNLKQFLMVCLDDYILFIHMIVYIIYKGDLIKIHVRNWKTCASAVRLDMNDQNRTNPPSLTMHLNHLNFT